jgi:hypothetical protein
MCHFETENNIIVMCSEVKNELYRLRSREKRNKRLTEWLNK